jgi:phospholipase/lecithinase/hemolysin
MRPQLALSCLLVGLWAVMAAPRAGAQPFTALHVFGDSLSDAGNLFRLTQAMVPKSPPYFAGRFSNGPVWAELLASDLHLPLTPALAGGTDFAVGGARTGVDVTDSGVTIPSLRRQVADMLAEAPAAGLDPQALYVLQGGGNDILAALADRDPLVVLAAAQAVAQALRALAEAGAIQVLVVNVGNVGRSPFITSRQDPGLDALATSLSLLFNVTLARAVRAVHEEFPQLQLRRLHLFALLEAVTAHPEPFGFTNVTEACLQGGPEEGGTPCATPDQYLHWDGNHPTAPGHAIIARVALQVVLRTPARAPNQQAVPSEGA